MVILDTNIIIDHLRRTDESFLDKISKHLTKNDLAILVLSIQELYSGKSTHNNKSEEFLLATIASLRILPYTYEIAKLAGEIERETDREIEAVDAAIAATAITHEAELFTLNRKDFLGIKNLQLYKI